MGEFDVRGPELKRLLKIAKERPLAFAYNPGSGPKDDYFGLDKRKPAKVLWKASLAEGAGKRAAYGMASVEGKILSLTCEREIPAIAKKLKKYLKSEKISMNVRIVGPDGTALEEDIEEDLPGDSDPAPDSPDTPPPPAQDEVAPDSPDMEALTESLRSLGQRIQRLDPDTAPPFVKLFNKLKELLKAKDGARLAAGIDKVNQALDKLPAPAREDGPKKEETAPKTDKADRSAAQWAAARSKLEPAVDKALKRNAGDVSKIRAYWQLALEKAEQEAFSVALKVAPALAKLLKDASREEPQGAEAGTVEARRDDLTSGKALLSALSGLRDDLNSALRALPDRVDEVKTLAREITSAVSGNALDLARESLGKIEAVIEEARELKERAAKEMAETAKAYEAATARGKGDLDSLRAAFAYAQGKLESAQYTAALAALTKVRELLKAAGQATTSEAEEAIAAAGKPMQDRIATLEDARALRDELDALTPRMTAILPFVPAQEDNAARLAEQVKSASATGDLDGARKALGAYAAIIAEGEYEQGVVTARKKNLLESLTRLTNPKGATAEEIAAFDAQRKIVGDALSADAPASEDFGRATAALRKLDTLLAPARKRAELRAALDKVLAERDAQTSEITRLSQLPGDTKLAVKLQRRLAYQNGQIDKLVKAEKLKAAQDMLGALKGTMAELKAEEEEIRKAGALKEQALREHGALKAQLSLARTIYAVTPDLEADVQAFKDADQNAGRLLYSKSYAQALGAIDTLKRALSRLTARKAEFDKGVKARRDYRKKVIGYSRLKTQYQLTPLTTPEAKTLFDTLNGLESEIDNLANGDNWTQASEKLDEAIATANKLIALRAACEALVADRAEALKRFNAVCDHAGPIAARAGATPEFVKRCEDLRTKVHEFVENYDNTRDTAKCLAIAAELETLDKDLEALDKADKAAIAERNKVRAEYTKAKAKLDEALGVRPNTDKMLGLYKTFQSAWDAFVAADRAAASDCMDRLKETIRTADLVLAEKDDNDKAAAEAKKACLAREATVKPEAIKASTTARSLAPDLADLNAELEQQWGSYSSALRDKRYLEAIEFLDAVAAVAVRIEAAKAGAVGKRDQRKKEYETRYSSAFIAQLNAVLAYKNVSHDIKSKKVAADSLSDDAEDAAGKGQYHIALAKLDQLEPVVAELIGMKALHDQLLADRKWVDDEWAKIDADIQTADDMGAVDRATADKVAAYTEARKRCAKAYDEKRYSDSRAAFPAFKTATAELLALKAQHDQAAKKKDAANAEWGKIKDDHRKASAMRPLTPELAKLIDAFHEADALFNKAYFGHDYDAAVAVADRLGKAVKALIAKEADHAAAELVADTKAGEAETALEAISETDLKAKSSQEKIDLLNNLRAQKKKLTDKQRELQRKLYMSMELDEDFIKVDDKRRDRLKEAIRNDKELQAARENWASTEPGKMIDADRKIALLTKTLKAECEIYGMPVPTVQTFSEPPGDLGSFNPGNNVISINIHEEATFDDFFDTIDTIVHENAHNYQDFLVTRLQEGLLQPGDPEYMQALLFAANSESFGYVTGSEDHDCYLKQPLEEHAWKTGGDVQKALKAPPKT